jgi:hypothetical protein
VWIETQLYPLELADARPAGGHEIGLPGHGAVVEDRVALREIRGVEIVRTAEAAECDRLVFQRLSHALGESYQRFAAYKAAPVHDRRSRRPPSGHLWVVPVDRHVAGVPAFRQRRPRRAGAYDHRRSRPAGGSG